MMGIKDYETVRTALLVEWNKIADQVPTTLRNAVDAGIAAVTGASVFFYFLPYYHTLTRKSKKICFGRPAARSPSFPRKSIF